MSTPHQTWTLPGPRLAITATALFFSAGCSWVHPPAQQSVAPKYGHLIDSKAIIASGGQTAWEVLQRTSFVRTREDRDGRPAKIWQRGHGTILLDDSPMVAVDGVPQSDFRVLGQILATNIDNIRVLNATEGAYVYGIRAGCGAILIETRLEIPPAN